MFAPIRSLLRAELTNSTGPRNERWNPRTTLDKISRGTAAVVQHWHFVWHRQTAVARRGSMAERLTAKLAENAGTCGFRYSGRSLTIMMFCTWLLVGVSASPWRYVLTSGPDSLILIPVYANVSCPTDTSNQRP